MKRQTNAADQAEMQRQKSFAVAEADRRCHENELEMVRFKRWGKVPAGIFRPLTTLEKIREHLHKGCRVCLGYDSTRMGRPTQLMLGDRGAPAEQPEPADWGGIAECFSLTGKAAEWLWKRLATKERPSWHRAMSVLEQRGAIALADLMTAARCNRNTADDALRAYRLSVQGGGADDVRAAA